MQGDERDRLRILEAIDRPLGFYVLALLIVESFIGLLAGFGGESTGNLRVGLYLGVGMFVYITLIVTMIVWKKAHLLTFDRDAHLTERRAPFGTEQGTLPDPISLPPAQEAIRP